MIIILLGEGCNISWHMKAISLRGPSSLFEWFLSVSFQDINFIVKKMLNNEPIEITKRYGSPELERDIYLDTTAIRSAHYDLKNFPDHLVRRTLRFREQIMSGEPILFIREENNGYVTTEQDIIEFKSLIEKFNPNCNYRILLLMPFEIKRPKLVIENLYHVENLRDKIQTELLQYIKEIEQTFKNTK